MNLTDIFKTRTKTLLKRVLPRKLTKAGYAYQRGKGYIYAEGNIPVILVAHVDTVHKHLPRQIYYDRKYRVLWSPDGLGADDRAGVLAILQLIKKGYRPYVLFTDGEEKGGWGAFEAAEQLDPPNVYMIIEFDRRGSNDAVYYACDCPELEEYIQSYGFEKAVGTFSDISVLCPAWGIAGVNLSTGYYNAHSKAEYLKLDELERNISRVAEMLENPPKELFEYREAYFAYGYSGYGTADEYGLYLCDVCGEICDEIFEDEYGWHLCEYCYKTLYGKSPVDMCEGGDTNEIVD